MAGGAKGAAGTRGIIELEADAMAISVRMHFDGKVFVPEEPVDLPVNQTVEAELHIAEPKLSAKEIARRRAAWKRAGKRAVKGASIPLEALRRENLYEPPPRGL